MVAVITPGGNNGSVVKNKMKIRCEVYSCLLWASKKPKCNSPSSFTASNQSTILFFAQQQQPILHPTAPLSSIIASWRPYLFCTVVLRFRYIEFTPI
eukprot:scaffold12431_cov137-Skeletonema_dohrnii-CCMP3373.AAC.3